MIADALPKIIFERSTRLAEDHQHREGTRDNASHEQERQTGSGHKCDGQEKCDPGYERNDSVR
jgi:hypothetical protein